MTLIERVPDFALTTALAGRGAHFRSTDLDRRWLSCHVVMGMLIPSKPSDESYCEGSSTRTYKSTGNLQSKKSYKDDGLVNIRKTHQRGDRSRSGKQWAPPQHGKRVARTYIYITYDRWRAYFVLLQCGGSQNERSSCTLAECLHSMSGPGFIVDYCPLPRPRRSSLCFVNHLRSGYEYLQIFLIIIANTRERLAPNRNGIDDNRPRFQFLHP